MCIKNSSFEKWLVLLWIMISRGIMFGSFVQPKGKGKGKGKKGKGKGKGKGKASAVIDGISTEEMTKEQVATA